MNEMTKDPSAIVEQPYSRTLTDQAFGFDIKAMTFVSGNRAYIGSAIKRGDSELWVRVTSKEKDAPRWTYGQVEVETERELIEVRAKAEEHSRREPVATGVQKADRAGQNQVPPKHQA